MANVAARMSTEEWYHGTQIVEQAFEPSIAWPAPKPRGRPHPIQVLVEVHAHHLAAAGAQHRHHGLKPVVPDVHDADFNFGHAAGSFNHRYEFHLALQNII